jgi:hypothetical protein
MAERKNLAGQRFGRLTVLDNFIEFKNTQGKTERKWLCRCDCGTEHYFLERSVFYGEVLSCGCLRLERAKEKTTLNLTGKTFGDLTVLEQVDERSPQGGIQWRCRCSCGAEYIVAGTLLVTGRRTHCPDRKVHRDQLKYKTGDITGRKFNRLTALYPTTIRDNKGSVIWHCRCDCGNEVDFSYNDLKYADLRSCGCQKIENDQKLHDNLTHVAGTSVDIIKSKKLPTDNTTGYKGVYLIKGKYAAKIVFQKKQYYLGTYSNIEDAAKARREGEILLFEGTAEYYARWQKRADEDPEWAKANPVSIQVSRNSNGELTVSYEPLV